MIFLWAFYWSLMGYFWWWMTDGVVTYIEQGVVRLWVWLNVTLRKSVIFLVASKVNFRPFSVNTLQIYILILFFCGVSWNIPKSLSLYRPTCSLIFPGNLHKRYDPTNSQLSAPLKERIATSNEFEEFFLIHGVPSLMILCAGFYLTSNEISM